jgi:hypothetical protein
MARMHGKERSMEEYHVGDYVAYDYPVAGVVHVYHTPTNTKVRKFTGEQAWTDATRYAYDMHIAFEVLRNYDEPWGRNG